MEIFLYSYRNITSGNLLSNLRSLFETEHGCAHTENPEPFIHMDLREAELLFRGHAIHTGADHRQLVALLRRQGTGYKVSRFQAHQV